MANIQAFCLDWHIDRSPAFKDLLVYPLKDKCKIELDPWDGEELDASRIKDEKALSFFVNFPHPPIYWREQILK